MEQWNPKSDFILLQKLSFHNMREMPIVESCVGFSPSSSDPTFHGFEGPSRGVQEPDTLALQTPKRVEGCPSSLASTGALGGSRLAPST